MSRVEELESVTATKTPSFNFPFSWQEGGTPSSPHCCPQTSDTSLLLLNDRVLDDEVMCRQAVLRGRRLLLQCALYHQRVGETRYSVSIRVPGALIEGKKNSIGQTLCFRFRLGR